jgi:zinc/manganese transport system permease protein
VRPLIAVGYQPNWPDVLRLDFMRSALAAGLLVAVAAGMLGYFVVVRRHAFAVHALAHIGFPGATAAVLVGVPVTAGLVVFCVGGAVVMGALGRRVADREVATGTVLALATGLGLLFNSMGTGSPGAVTSVLFGNLLAVSSGQVLVFAAFTLALAGVMAVIARPLTFASVAPEVAEARGVPVSALNLAFLVLLGLVVAMAVQIVGTLLLFGLVVTPAATALAITARPVAVVALSTAVGAASAVLGIVASVVFAVPASFAVVTLSTAAWAVAVGTTRWRRPPAGPGGARPVDAGEGGGAAVGRAPRA